MLQLKKINSSYIVVVILLIVITLVMVLVLNNQNKSKLPVSNHWQNENNKNQSDREEINISNQNKYKNDKYGYELQYSKDEVEIVLDEVLERGTEGNPSFRIKTGGHFAIGVWDNSENLTARQWIDEQYMIYSGGWYGEFKEVTVEKEKAYSALVTEPCYIEWIIIPKSNRFYTFGVEFCDENIDVSLDIFKSIVGSFKFL